MNTLVIGIIIAMGLLTFVILFAIYNDESKQLEYNLDFFCLSHLVKVTVLHTSAKT
ncbi:MAG TPA: hypothetical protein VLA53_02935 [Nitrosopumilaceae archaeon]|nr:hypothetical protein [Nitrosopumilaceae archaeon]